MLHLYTLPAIHDMPTKHHVICIQLLPNWELLFFLNWVTFHMHIYVDRMHTCTHIFSLCVSLYLYERHICLCHPTTTTTTTTTIALIWQLLVSVLVTVSVTYFVSSMDTIFFSK